LCDVKFADTGDELLSDVTEGGLGGADMTLAGIAGTDDCDRLQWRNLQTGGAGSGLAETMVVGEGGEGLGPKGPNPTRGLRESNEEIDGEVENWKRRKERERKRTAREGGQK
jgi:hypothetical protein